MSSQQALAVDPSHFGRAVVDSAAMDWVASPAAGIWRKRLDHVGPPEAGRVTSIVRFDAGARFPYHGHPEGEEILVLEGTWADEHGIYPAGSHLLNPEGHGHAPWSDDGCTLFVKLRQYAGRDRQTTATDSAGMDWSPGSVDGLEVKPLYGQAGFPETIRLVRFAPGARVPHHAHPGGEEAFVLAGSVSDENGSYAKGTWVRYPVGSAHSAWSDEGCLLYVCTGGLPTPD